MNKLSNIQLYHHQREASISEMSRLPYNVCWGIKYNNKRYIVEKSESFAKLLLYNSPGILPIHVTLLKPGEFVFCLEIVLNKLQYLSMGSLLRKKRTSVNGTLKSELKILQSTSSIHNDCLQVLDLRIDCREMPRF